MSEVKKNQYFLIITGGLVAILLSSVTFPMVWSEIQLPEWPSDDRPQFSKGDQVGYVHWIITTTYTDGSVDSFETEPDIVTVPLQLIRDSKEVANIEYEMRWDMLDGLDVESYTTSIDAYLLNEKVGYETRFQGDFPVFTFKGGSFSDDLFMDQIIAQGVVPGNSYLIVNSVDQGRICTVPNDWVGENWGVPCLEMSNQFGIDHLIPISESTLTLRVDGHVTLNVFDSGNNLYVATSQMTTVNYDMVYAPDPQTALATQPYITTDYGNEVEIEATPETGEVCNPVCGPAWTDLDAKREYDYYHVDAQTWNQREDGDCGIANEKCKVASVSYISPNCTNSPARGEECIEDGSFRQTATAVRYSVCDDATRTDCEDNDFLCSYIEEVEGRGFVYTGDRGNC